MRLPFERLVMTPVRRVVDAAVVLDESRGISDAGGS
jgi:hypothetical protein